MAVDIVPLAEGGIQLISVCLLMIVLASIFVSLRFYSRTIRKVPYQPEDYTILAALLMLWFEGSFIIAMTLLGGIGHHMVDLKPENITQMFKLSYGMQFGYAIGIGLVKCSLCMTLARILFYQPYRTAAIVAGILAICWSISTILVGILICTPISMFWNPLVNGGHCGNQNLAFAAAGTTDVIIDFFIMIIPLPGVFKLQIPLANKLAVASIFLLGLCTIAVGSLRVVSIVKLSFEDASYSGKIPDMLTILELGVAIIVTSCPILRPVFDKFVHATLPSALPNRSCMEAIEDIHGKHQAQCVSHTKRRPQWLNALSGRQIDEESGTDSLTRLEQESLDEDRIWLERNGRNGTTPRSYTSDPSPESSHSR
ncbi:hypothetical protein BT63DRAFT_89568 [Microthyrium microscopicum]|uniref:Rhodopsin domain-containing protein n=1 Tax=Microthyrium microscopicum TaxID=703497 RepID=A0A6A6TZ35_9PEZI|nr:hypothetical protein BT63DRAFT_89568 [Microthyrium microscopicum]